MTDRAEVVVIGAGIAGISAAYHLAVRQGVTDLVVVDPRPPLSLTSDKSTECYRNWWPNPPMVGLMNRSIDLLEEMAEESNDVFGLSRRGYLFVTAEPDRMEWMRTQAEITSGYEGGAVRQHPGPVAYGPARDGVDLLGPDHLAHHFPYITETAVGALHVRRAGWFSAQQLGAWMLDRVRDAGGALMPAEVTGIRLRRDRVTGVTLDDGREIVCDTVVMAAGPMSKPVAGLAGVELPLFSELHLKVAFRDHLGVIPRDAPMIIWSDPQHIGWSPEERAELDRIGRHDLLGEMPVFCHGRPEGHGSYFLALWEYHQIVSEPVWPLPQDDLYPEVVMRGLATMVPGLEGYLHRLPESFVDGGYYTKTRENRPLVGPCGPEGFHVITAMSGFGVMVAAGAGDLLAKHVVGAPLPEYANSFLLSRYDDPGYLVEISELADSGQL